MTEYEELINKAALDVIRSCGMGLERPQIRREMKKAFKALNDTYRMQDVHTDAVKAYDVVCQGYEWYCPRHVFTRQESIERGLVKQSLQRQKERRERQARNNDQSDLVNYLREIQPYRAKKHEKSKTKRSTTQF